MRNSRRSLSVAVVVVAAFLGVAAAAHAFPPWPSTALTSAQLKASSAAAVKYGIPVNIERGVTTFKYGKASTTANFKAEAARLEWWYGKLYPTYGGAALVNWTRAAAAEMGKGASPTDVAMATGNQQAALNGILTDGFWSTVATLLPGAASVGAAAGEVGLGGAVDTTGTGAAATTGGTGAAAGSAGASGAAGKAGSIFGNGASDTPADVMRTVSIAGLATVATYAIAHEINRPTQVNLTTGWFSSLYHTIVDYAWVLAVLAIVAAAMHIMVQSIAGTTSGFGLLLARIPLAAIVMVGVPVIAVAGIAIVDELCANLLTLFPHTTTVLHALGDAVAVLGGVSGIAAVTHHAGVASVTGLGAWVLSLAALVGAGAIWLELMARTIAIYLTVLVLPLALVGEIFSPFARWAGGMVKALVVVIAAKFILVFGLAMGATLLAAGIASLSLTTILTGVAALIVIALFPAVVYGAVLRTGESAWHSGAGQNVSSSPHHAMASHVRQAAARAQGRPTDQARVEHILRDIRDQQSGTHNGYSHNGTYNSNGTVKPPPPREPVGVGLDDE